MLPRAPEVLRSPVSAPGRLPAYPLDAPQAGFCEAPLGLQKQGNEQVSCNFIACHKLTRETGSGTPWSTTSKSRTARSASNMRAAVVPASSSCIASSAIEYQIQNDNLTVQQARNQDDTLGWLLLVACWQVLNGCTTDLATMTMLHAPFDMWSPAITRLLPLSLATHHKHINQLQEHAIQCLY